VSNAIAEKKGRCSLKGGEIEGGGGKVKGRNNNVDRLPYECSLVEAIQNMGNVIRGQKRDFPKNNKGRKGCFQHPIPAEGGKSNPSRGFQSSHKKEKAEAKESGEKN